MSERVWRGLIFIGIVLLPFMVGPLLTYEVIKLELPTDMADQASIGFQEGPRLAEPEGAVPVTGKAILLDTVAPNVVPADDVSIRRGRQLYATYCALCHGEDGAGDGPLAHYYEDRPLRSLTSSSIFAQFDGQLFQTITEGYSRMPPQAEAMSPRERWDVINYIRTLGE